MRRFLSICSGIEAASVAFQPLGWEAVAFAEIEPFPCRVLAHHYGASRPRFMPQPVPMEEIIAQCLKNTPWATWAITRAILDDNQPLEAAIRTVADLPIHGRVPNFGDLTRFREWDAELLAQADVLCGGTPCQAFSVAGLRGSLDDERGNLTLTFCHLYDHLDDLRIAAGRPPAVCLWENVPGIFSDKQNAFGCFLAALAGEGLPLQPPGGKWTDAGAVLGPRRAVAWRTLDAQYHGLAQRRRRVFVVASADPDFDPAAVLLEFDGVRRDSPPSREAGESTAHGFETGPGGGQFTNLAPTLDTRCKDGPIRNQLGIGVVESDGAVIAEPLTARPYADHLSQEGRLVPEVFPTLDANHDRKWGSNQWVNNGFAILEQQAVEVVGALPTHHTPNGHGCAGVNNQAVNAGHIIPERLSGTQCAHAENVAPVLQSVNPTAVAYQAESEGQRAESPDAFAFQPRIARNGRGDMGDKVNALQAQSGQSGKGDAGPCVAYTVHGTREGTQAVATPTDTAGTIREGTGSAVQNSSNTLVAFDTTQITSKTNRRQPKQGDPCHPLAVGAHAPAIALSKSPRLPVSKSSEKWAVRRLTPEECELLQGFPIGYTLLPDAKGKRKPDDLSDTIDYLVALGFPLEHARRVAATPDGPRYKALGNSWAVPCVRWIARRIEAMLSNPNSL